MDTDISLSSHHHRHHHHLNTSRIDSPSDDGDGDGEGVWSPDIEECFREALLMYPPCGRRKHILHEEGDGKMYGRNELIARHIKMKTGKLRTRKQVSSHIQVLARRKAKAEAHAAGSSNGVSPSPSSIGSGGQPQSAHSIKQEEQMQQLHMQLSQHQQQNQLSQSLHHNHNLQPQPTAAPTLCHPAATGASSADLYPASDLWFDRPIVTQKIRLVEFSAFIEHRQPAKPSLITSNISTYHDNHHSHNHHLDRTSNQTATHLKQSVVGSSDEQTVRHSYVHIDYRQQGPFSFARHHSIHSRSMLESINIKQIHDKLPGFAGPDGYMQRGSPDAFYLVKFWANLGGELDFNMEDQNSCFGFSSYFDTIEPYRSLTCSIKACSYGFPAVEKVEKMYGAYNQSNGRYMYNLDRSPMCEFMIQFIRKLRQLPMISHMNSVLENFTVLQVIENDTLPVPEVLLCLAYVFEVASSEQNNGPSYHVYKLTKD